MKKQGWPEKGELVIVKIKRIMDYGAVADLIEYEDRDGFIHISNVTKSWVKNIRSHVSTGETRVAEVTKVEEDKNTINLSLKTVNETQMKRKMNQWKREKRTNRTIEQLAEKLEKDPEEAKKEIIPKLTQKYEDPYETFEEASAKGEEALKDIDIPEEWKEEIINYSKENIKPPEVTIEGKFNIETLQGNGIELIKKALKPITKENVKVEYVSAPEYKLKITARDYEEAEKELKEAKEKVKKGLNEKAKMKFERKQK